MQFTSVHCINTCSSFDSPEAPSKSNFYSFSFQFLIVVVDSTDRERLPVTKAELYNMLNHEVRSLFFVQSTLFVHPRELSLNPLSPNSDQQQFSPNDTHTLS